MNTILSLEKIKKEVDSSSVKNRNFFGITLGALLYIQVIAFGTSDIQILLLNEGVTLPFVGVNVPLLGFYVVIPLVVLAIHFNLLQNLESHLFKLRKWSECFKQNIVPREAIQPFIFDFSILERGGTLTNLTRFFSFFLILWLAPFTLMVVLVRMTDYQDTLLTGWHYASFLLDVYIVTRFTRALSERPQCHTLRFMSGWSKNTNIWNRLSQFFNRVATHYPKLGAATSLITSSCWRCLTLLPMLFGLGRRLHGYLRTEELSSLPKRGIWTFRMVAFIFMNTALLFSLDIFLIDLRIFTPSFGFYFFTPYDGHYAEKNPAPHALVSLLEPRITLSANLPTPVIVADLSNRSLRGVIFHDRITLEGRKTLEGAKLQQASFTGAQLRGADFSGAQLQGADFTGAHLQGASFYKAQLQGASFAYTELQGAYFAYAQLQGAYMPEARLQGAYLSGAHLQGATLELAQLQGADLHSAQLQGAILKFAKLQAVDLYDAQLQGADLSDAELHGASLRKAQLQGSNISGAHMRGLTNYLPEQFSHVYFDKPINADDFPTKYEWQEWEEILNSPEYRQRLMAKKISNKKFKFSVALTSVQSGELSKILIPALCTIGPEDEGLKIVSQLAALNRVTEMDTLFNIFPQIYAQDILTRARQSPECTKLGNPNRLRLKKYHRTGGEIPIVDEWIEYGHD